MPKPLKEPIDLSMMKRRILIILNPIAGKGTAGQRRAELEALLKGRNIEYDLVLTKEVRHATALARDAGKNGYGVVVAAGGDGTINEVINGLMSDDYRDDPRPVLGALAMGRGNDFAYGADIPEKLNEGVDVIAAGKTRPLDVGLITGGDYPEGLFFGNGVGIGFDTIVGLEAAKMKRVHGFMAYVFGALKTFLLYPEAPLVRLGFRDRVIEQESHQISIMNGKRMGGVFFMAPDARNYDGEMNLCMATRLKRRDMAASIIRYLKGTQGELPFFTTDRSASFSIDAPEGGLVVHADGETVCVNGFAVRIECLPGKISLLCSC